MSLARYMSLRKTIQDKLDAPFSIEDASHVTRHFTDAMNAYASVMLTDTTAECKYASARMLLAIEYLSIWPIKPISTAAFERFQKNSGP